MFLLLYLTSAGWERVSGRRAGVGESEGFHLVAWAGDILENQVRSPGHAAGGVVWRWDVLRGEKHSPCAEAAETSVE